MEICPGSEATSAVSPGRAATVMAETAFPQTLPHSSKCAAFSWTIVFDLALLSGLLRWPCGVCQLKAAQNPNQSYHHSFKT